MYVLRTHYVSILPDSWYIFFYSFDDHDLMTLFISLFFKMNKKKTTVGFMAVCICTYSGQLFTVINKKTRIFFSVPIQNCFLFRNSSCLPDFITILMFVFFHRV